MKRTMGWCIQVLSGFILFFTLIAQPVRAQAILIDHTCTDLSQIPFDYIGLVTNSAKMLYGHTSHGSQITVGMQRIEDSDAFYSVAIDANFLPDEPGAVCILDPGYLNPQDYFTYGPGRLNAYPTINFSMYSWCTQQNTNTEADTQAYLNGMEAMEASYPDVTFIYMTGNAQADGSEGYNRYLRNNQIRDYCQAHGKILFDFADMDCWYNGQQHTYNYQGQDIPLEHPQFNGDQAGHTTYESCELKAAAAWWMMAMLYGWNPGGSSEDHVSLITGPGPGMAQDSRIRGFTSEGDMLTSCNFLAFSDIHGYGAVVASGEFNGDGGNEIITGPGPGFSNPPRVRGFSSDGILLPGFDFLAYGISKYGVRLASGHMQGDAVSDLLTAPGPGNVFGPHIRGWTYSNGNISSIPGINFIAYGTKKFGANVACGNTNHGGPDEIITGAGSGPVFGPHVRGWTYSGGTVTPIGPSFSYMAYGTRKWGVRVASGDVDQDLFDEIITTPGPGPVFGPHIRGWNFDASAISQLPGCSYFAYGSHLKYGALSYCGDIEGDGRDEILTGPGPGPTYSSHVRGWRYAGGGIAPLDNINFLAYQDLQYNYGVNVAVLDTPPDN